MTNNVGLTFSVGDTILQFTITSIEQEKLELVILNTINFSVVLSGDQGLKNIHTSSVNQGSAGTGTTFRIELQICHPSFR